MLIVPHVLVIWTVREINVVILTEVPENIELSETTLTQYKHRSSARLSCRIGFWSETEDTATSLRCFVQALAFQHLHEMVKVKAKL